MTRRNAYPMAVHAMLDLSGARRRTERRAWLRALGLLALAAAIVATFVWWGWMIAGPIWCGLALAAVPLLASVGLDDGGPVGRHGRRS